MKIEWFTVVAQALNFLVLVTILKFVLFDRIVRSIDSRREAIGSEQKATRKALADASAAQDAMRRQQEELEARREAELQQAREAADARRKELEADAIREADKLRARLVEGIRSEQRELTAELVRSAARGAMEAARQALADLSDTALQERIVKRLLTTIRGIGEDQREPIRNAWGGLGKPLRVVSSHELTAEERDTLLEALAAVLGARPSCTFEVSDELAMGLEISGGGRSLGWSVRSYLADLEHNLDAILNDETMHEAARSETEEEGTHDDAPDAEGAPLA